MNQLPKDSQIPFLIYMIPHFFYIYILYIHYLIWLWDSQKDMGELLVSVNYVETVMSSVRIYFEYSRKKLSAITRLYYSSKVKDVIGCSSIQEANPSRGFKMTSLKLERLPALAVTSGPHVMIWMIFYYKDCRNCYIVHYNDLIFNRVSIFNNAICKKCKKKQLLLLLSIPCTNIYSQTSPNNSTKILSR